MKIYYIVYMQIDRHHLLEIILWPNDDGTFRRIINSEKRLRELGIYDDFKLTIKLTKSEHTTLHNMNMSDARIMKLREANLGAKNPMYGKHLSAEARQSISRKLKGRKFSDEHRAKISAANSVRPISDKLRQVMSKLHKGTHWYNNGSVNVQAFECPSGFKPGRLKFKKKEDQKF